MRFKRILFWNGLWFLMLGSLSPALQAGIISREYTWTYNNTRFEESFAIDENSYAYYHNLRRTYSSFLTYLDESAYFPVISSFSDRFRQLASEHHFSDWQTVECMIAFVQQLQYMSDGEYEYPKFPVETLVDGGGDCEDSAILLEALLRALGFDAVFIAPPNHLGVGIAIADDLETTRFPLHGRNYYFIETTDPGWCIGDYPAQLNSMVSIYAPGQNEKARLLSSDRYSFCVTAGNATLENL